MLDAVAGIDEMDGHAVEVSTSIGIALYPADGQDADTSSRTRTLRCTR